MFQEGCLCCFPPCGNYFSLWWCFLMLLNLSIMHQTRDFFIRGDLNCWSPPKGKTSLLHLPRMQDSERAWNFVFLNFCYPFGVSLTMTAAEVWVWKWAQWFWTCATQGLDQHYMNCVMLNEKCGDTQYFSHTSQLSLEKWEMGWDLDIL
jgi:hypothetical protein